MPHWELKGSTYFVTFRVDQEIGKPFQDPELAQIMESFLFQENKTKYLLHAYVIMPDHVHIIIKPLADNTLAKIMQQIKGSSSNKINKKMNRSGKFWQTENFDHLIRDAAGLHEKWIYIKENPVQAKLVKHAEDYPFSSFYQQRSVMSNGLKSVETSAD